MLAWSVKCFSSLVLLIVSQSDWLWCKMIHNTFGKKLGLEGQIAIAIAIWNEGDIAGSQVPCKLAHGNKETIFAEDSKRYSATMTEIISFDLYIPVSDKDFEM